MTPTEAIAKLDGQLALHGETVTLRRYTAPTGNPRPKIDVTARALVRVISNPQLVGEVSQDETHISLSPTAVTAAAWPLPVQSGDKIVVQGIERNIDTPKPILLNDTLVRINLVVRG
jgi:hypothetical protein